MTELWACPYCDYKGSEAWTHLMTNHIDIRDDWDPNRKKDGFVFTKFSHVPKYRMHKITRRLEFDAGHRVYQHESKCNHIHGHRYVVEVECTGSLDELGRIVDFSVIKTKFGKWIDDNLDHGMILFSGDPLVDVWRMMGNEDMKQSVEQNSCSDRVFNISQQKHYVMDKNPTAENLAELLYKQANDMLTEDGFTVTKITIWETPNCRAEYTEQ